MTRAEELRALAERVEAHAIADKQNREAMRAALNSWYLAEETFRAWEIGSLDACAALHKAMLGERWSVDRIEQWPDQGDWVVCLASASREIGAQGARARTEARARLATILRALAEEEGQADG